LPAYGQVETAAVVLGSVGTASPADWSTFLTVFVPLAAPGSVRDLPPVLRCQTSDEHGDPLDAPGRVLALPVDPERPIHRCRPPNIRRKKRQSALPSPGSSSLRSRTGSPSAPLALDTHVAVAAAGLWKSRSTVRSGRRFLRSAWTCSRAERSPGRRREPRSRRPDLPGLATPALLSGLVLHMRPAFVPEGGRAARPSPPGALRAALTARPFLPRVLGLPS
jgi:hypothetical protein